VAEGVYWLRMPLPFALDHINLWLLRDGDGWVIVDSGFGSNTTIKLWEQIFSDQLDRRPVKRVIVTHLHPDHLGLGAWLADRFRVEVWMTQAEFLLAHTIWEAQGGDLLGRLANLYRRHGLDEARVALIAGRAGSYRLGVPALPATYRRLIGGDDAIIDGRAWRVIIGHGHSPEHAALYCESLGVLISGDMVLPKITTNVSIAPLEPEGDPLQRFLDSLDRFARLPEDTLVLPSHGLVFHGLHPRLAQLHEHHAERFDIILEACREPRSAPDLLPYLFKREFDAHQLSFAMGETVAHLNLLMHAKRLQRIDADGRYRFVRVAA
jgi:glyoxylase-like metal-dependent hydrolase (beta-lactamase superfamily II)